MHEEERTTVLFTWPRNYLTYGRCCKSKYVNVQRNANQFCLRDPEKDPTYGRCSRQVAVSSRVTGAGCPSSVQVATTRGLPPLPRQQPQQPNCSSSPTAVQLSPWCVPNDRNIRWVGSKWKRPSKIYNANIGKTITSFIT